MAKAKDMFQRFIIGREKIWEGYEVHYLNYIADFLVYEAGEPNKGLNLHIDITKDNRFVYSRLFTLCSLGDSLLFLGRQQEA